jgi:chaperone required for assembly of F1-ATPase
VSGKTTPTLPPPGQRRGYRDVHVRSVEGGFSIALDAKPLRTPAGTPIVVPQAALAEALAAEWRGQGDKLDLNAVPITRIAATALDRVRPRRTERVAQLLEYAETELLCHRAPEPDALIARQAAVWQPLLDWLALRFDAPLTVTSGIHVRPHPPDSLAALRRELERSDDWRLAGLAITTGVAGSLVIGLALAEGRLDAGGAFEAAELDASFQIERWGEDAEAMARRAEIQVELAAVATFLRLLTA